MLSSADRQSGLVWLPSCVRTIDPATQRIRSNLFDRAVSFSRLPSMATPCEPPPQEGCSTRTPFGRDDLLRGGGVLRITPVGRTLRTVRDCPGPVMLPLSPGNRRDRARQRHLQRDQSHSQPAAANLPRPGRLPWPVARTADLDRPNLRNPMHLPHPGERRLTAAYCPPTSSRTLDTLAQHTDVHGDRYEATHMSYGNR